MDKHHLLENVSRLIKEGQLSKQELLSVYEQATLNDRGAAMNRQNKISNILYFIGGMIVFLGVGVFVGTNWNTLSDVTKVLATLGVSVALYVAAVLMSRTASLERVTDVFYFISALVMPTGIFTAFYVSRADIGTTAIQTTVAGIVFVTFLISHLVERRNVFFIFHVIFGTWLFFCLSNLIVNGRPFMDWDYIKYRWLVAGLSHMIMGYALANTSRKEFTPALYGFGVVEFLGAALSLGGKGAYGHPLWDVLFPGLNFGIIFLSVYLKSKAFLVFGTIFLMFYVMKITGDYFSSGFGWSLSLILIGFALIAIGYGAFYLNKRYISTDH